MQSDNIKNEKSKEDVIAERKKRKEEEAKKKAEQKEKKANQPEKEVKKEEKKEEIKKKTTEIYQSKAKIPLNIGKEVYVCKDKKNILITSALPYVNNEPHLGNIIGCVLSADVYARFCRLMDYNTIYICGTDEFGTATETKAIKEGITPKELCDKYHQLHKGIYEWFDIDFNIFGRTPTENHKVLTQDVFNKLKHNNNIVKRKTQQLKCLSCNNFLADRFVIGTCYYPSCSYQQAGGDQCDGCGKLMTPTELINPKCKICGSKPEVSESYHYFIDLPKIEPKLREWLNDASKEWSNNSSSLAKGFLHEGLIQRCITRDLKWGIDVPGDDEDMKNKVFYVWFDAPVGYISITKTLVNDKWEEWWKNPENVKLVQFMGKDNVTFHSIMFPSSLIGTGENYTKVNSLSTTEYLTYEGDKFSKTNEIGVFGSQAKETGIPCEVWRYYLLSIRPENGDTDFFWDKFAEKANSELQNNLGNLCHRVFSFVNSKYDHIIPSYISNEGKNLLKEEDYDHIDKVKELFNSYISSMEKIRIKEGLEYVMKIASEGNIYLNKLEPWKVYKEDKDRCGAIQFILLSTIRLIALLSEPFIPSFSAKVYEILNIQYGTVESKLLSIVSNNFNEEYLKLLVPKGKINECHPIFEEITKEKVTLFSEKFRGNKK